MPTATSSLPPAAAGAAALPAGAGAEHRAALLRYAAQLLESEPERAAEIVDAVLAETAAAPDEATGERTAEKLYAACRRRVLIAGRRETGWQESAAEGEPRGATLAEQIRSLTAKQREAVWLRFQHGFNYEAIAHITRLSLHQVGFLLHSALMHLREERTVDAAALATSDDPRVTAYALDEMNADERTAFEKELKSDEVARRVAREVDGLAAELQSALGGSGPRRAPGRRTSAARRRIWRRVAAAGALLLLVAGAWWWSRRVPEPAAAPASARTEIRMQPDPWRLGAARPKELPRSDRPGGGADEVSAPAHAATARGPMAPAEPLQARAPDEEVSVVVRQGGGPGAGAAPGGAGEAASAPGGGTRLSDSADPASAAQPTAMGNGGAATGAGGAAAAATAASEAGSGGATSASAPAPPGRGGKAPAPAAPPAPSRASTAAAMSAASSRQQNGTAPGSAAPRDPETASFHAWRAAIAARRLPPPGAVRADELVNTVPVGQSAGAGRDGLAVAVEVARAPWSSAHRLARVVVTAPPAPRSATAAANVVLLVDVSGSMAAPNRLPLVQDGVRRWLDGLRPEDRVALVTYAAGAQVALAPTPVEKSADILAALAAMNAEGMTNAGVGLHAAYAQARAGLVRGGVNRVVLCSDGEFNAGVTDAGALASLVREQALAGIELSVYGFGRGRAIDARLEALAVQGRGTSGYLNTRRETAAALAVQVAGAAAGEARDVRLDVTVDPARVAGWRLVGRDDQMLPPEAANLRPALMVKALAPGQSWTALYEFESAAEAGEWLTLKIAETRMDGASREQTVPVTDRGRGWEEASAEFRFAAAVAGLGLALGDESRRHARLAEVVRWAGDAAAQLEARDPGGYREEFLALARETEELARGER